MQAWKGESYDLLSFMYVCGNKIIVIVIIIVIVNQPRVHLMLLLLVVTNIGRYYIDTNWGSTIWYYE